MREVRLAPLGGRRELGRQGLCQIVSERAVGAGRAREPLPAQMVIKIVNEELCALMGGQSQKLNIGSEVPERRDARRSAGRR